MRRQSRKAILGAVLTVAALSVLAPAAAPAAGAHPCEGLSPLDAEARLARYEPQTPGTERSYCLFYGPYTIPPGHDLSRVDLDLSLSDGFLVAGGPGLVFADGTEPGHQELHIHHAHWWFLEPGAPNYGPSVPFPGWKWISGSGEEETEGSFDLVSAAEGGNRRYGLAVREGERTLLINMIHNKTTRPIVVWVKVDLTFVHGTAAEIAGTTGENFRNLTPVLVGGSFDVPREPPGGDGVFVWPRDINGTGQVWTAPFDGTIVIGAGHLHPGGQRAIVTNMGRPSEPCASDRTDGIPGKTLYELDVINRETPLSEDFQIEITQPGFRATVRAGDRIVVNGVYESAEHGWWDAMTHTGFYVDEHPVAPADACSVELVGVPAGWSPPLGYPVLQAPTEGIANRAWTGDPDPLCGVTGSPACNRNLTPVPSGADTEVVTISNFQFTPGGLGLSGPLGPPRIARGTRLHVVNTDIAAYVRHTMTSCPSPCDGPYVTNYPLPDGAFDSGFLGYEPTTMGGPPYWEFDTSRLEPGRYTYFCRIHPWMRGAFDVV